MFCNYILDFRMLAIKEEYPSLHSKIWLKAWKLFWLDRNITKSISKDDLNRNCSYVFADRYNLKLSVSINLKNGAKPVCLKSQIVPFALRKAAALELEQLT